MQSHAAMTKASLCKDSLQAHWPRSFQEVLASLVLHMAPIGVPSLDAGHAAIRKNAVPRVCVVVYALYIATVACKLFLSQQVMGDAACPSHARSRLNVKVQEKYKRSIKSL